MGHPTFDLILCRKFQVSPRIAVANIFDEAAEERLIVGQFAADDFLSNEVAKDTPKVFVARIRHE